MNKEKKNIKKIEEEAKNNSVRRRGNLKKLRYIIYFSIFIIMSILTLYYIYNIFDKPSRIFIFKSLPSSMLLAIFILLIIYFLSDGLRLYFVLRTLKCEINFRSILKLVFINMFISNVTPFATGGGFVQVYFLTQKGVSLGDATAATTIRTVLATIIIFITAPLAIFTGKNIESMLPLDTLIIYMAVFTLLYISFFYIVIFNNNFVKKIVYKILYFLRNKNLISEKKFNNIAKYLFEEIDIFGNSLNSFFNGNKIYLISSIFFAIIFLLSELSFSVLLIKSLGYTVDYFLVILRQLVVVFFMYFAPTPGATGVAEGGFSLVFKNYVSASDMFPLIFAWRFLTKYIGMIIGLYIFFRAIFRRSRDND